MDESISTRTRSNLSSDFPENWKICEDNFKIPKRTPSKITNSTKNKKELISIINKEIGVSAQKYEASIHELNYLQRGLIFIFYKALETANEVPLDCQSDKCENDYEISKKYFIDDSDDSDPEYIDGDEIINRVNAERCILNRVEELKSNNLWSSKMINKKPDPPRPIFHWDLLVKEVKWLQGNISTLKQNKRIDARKLASAASKYVKEKEAQMAKLNKEETIKAKKHCINISKMIKEWWKQMQKIVSAKQKFRLDAKRQEAINDHLGKVIETTQKYTEWLTEDLKMVTSGDNDTSADDDPEFQVKGELTDDEETIAEDEMEMDYNVEEEINDLKRQNEMSLEDILNELPADYFKPIPEVNNNEEVPHEIDDVNELKSVSKNQANKENKIPVNQDLSINTDNIDSDDMKPDDSSEDCEDTMVEQEKYEEKDEEFNHGKEIDNLVNDAEIPIEDLLNLYKKMYQTSDADSAENDDEDEEEIMSESSSNLSESDDQDSICSAHTSSSYESSVDLGVVFNIDTEEVNSKETSEFQGQFQEITEVAMSTQPRGFTLESTDVKVQVPFLLKYSLREYQHVGLDWMAAIYEKRLNGVLADEMGLGKTIQTIALLAYLSCEKGIWGPHLVVVPTSVVLNWEIEFKKWCPGFKIITYFGSLKERKEKRKGWTKTNAFHVCITSYRLAIQDCQVFKRKKWRYIILDEAQNIKNFKSQRWQTLLTFNSQRRLLLTGTPLQNNLMELWSLMHFLMPNIFQSHREFNEWFGSPLSGMVEGSNEYNEQLVMRLHKVLRPFILRRLKKDVEKQMPQKYEHLVMCSLSKRQRFLYDDYMSLASTKEMLSSGQFMNIISILMQLRKVCNHPNLFEDRPTLSPFSMTQERIEYNYPKILLIDDLYDNRQTNGRPVLPVGTSGIADMALNMPRFVYERILGLTVKPNLIEEVDNIQVTDWVGKFHEKFSNYSQATSFIPSDLITYLKKSEFDEEIVVNLPTPLIYGLKMKKRSATQVNNILPESIVSSRRKERVERLRDMVHRNSIRCAQYSSIGPDVIDAVTMVKSQSGCSWDRMNLDILKTRTLEQFLNDNMEMIDKVTFVIPAVLSGGVRINTACRPLLNAKAKSEMTYNQSQSAIPICLSKIRQNQLVQFPDTRLIEYDCGKLQILVTLLKRLKAEGHRCLIFTQMTRMLDVLEQFLSYHGYRYLRLDGTTKIEQRQIMMEQFNKDDRIFVFILSTRSGGVGVNLTGADTVIFYDSDWNPTMDAQAQDRCHRIGQTRDVHIYRLISRMTIEENILKKANEKRHLNEMAIEYGQFNMSYFKTNTLQDIFQTPAGMDNSNANVATDDQANQPRTYKTIRGRTIRWKGDKSIFNNLCETEKVENKVIDSTQLEAALEEVEDESDRLAAKITRAEAKADLVEFDETVPWEDAEEGPMKSENDENRFRLEMESQLENFNSQLNPLQKYGVSWIELASENVLCTELELEENQIESNKQAWELDQIKALHEDHEEMKNIEEDDMLYIYGTYDPLASQREELEKLRKEEEFQHLQELLREEEIAKREKDKAAAQAWAQEQHKNALKRKSEIIDDEESSSNFTNSESFVRSPKQRKVVIPRLEFPDESITNVTSVKTVCISYADDIDQQIASSSSSSMITDGRTMSARRRRGHTASKNTSKRTSDYDYTDVNSDSQKNSSLLSWDNSLDNNGDASDLNSKIHTSFISVSESYHEKSHSTANNHTERKPFPQPRRMGRPPWKNIKPNVDGEYKPSSQIKKSFPTTRRYNRQSHTNLPMTDSQLENHSVLRRKVSLPLSRQFGKISPDDYQTTDNSNSQPRPSFPPSRRFGRRSGNKIAARNHLNRSPDENIAPFSNENSHLSNSASSFKQVCKSYDKFPMTNGYHDFPSLDKSDDFMRDPILMENVIQSNVDDHSAKKRRGRAVVTDLKRKSSVLTEEGTLPRHRNCSESTNASAILNKKNSFKIPVKTLNGEHKLFSAPLLLLKTKPVFVVTRKIEDSHGNIYTQNLTYPIESNGNFNAIAAKLSSFASNPTEK